MTRPTVTTLPATAPIADILDVLHRDGVIVLSGFASDAEVDALNAKAMPHFDRQEAEGLVEHKVKGFRASHTTVFYDLIGALPEETSKLLQRKVWARIMDEFLRHDAWDLTSPWMGEEKNHRKGDYLLHTSIAYKVSPGAGNQMLHRDQGGCMIQRTGPGSLPNMVSTFIAGCDVTERNGGTHVIPGSHLWPQDRPPKQEDAVAVEMKKGSLAIWLGDIFHGAGANTCQPGDKDAVRLIYGLFAVAGHFRPGEATLIACQPEEYEKMPPEVLRLLGFYKGNSGSGHLKGTDPIKVWPGLKGYSGGEWFYRPKEGEPEAIEGLNA